MKYRVYLSPSLQEHNPYANPPGGVESEHMRAIAAILATKLEATGAFETRMSQAAWAALPESVYLSKVVQDSNAFAPAIHVCIHSNAGGKGADGTDTYYYDKSAAGQRLAKALQAHVAPVSPGTDGGLHTATFYEVRATNAPAALIELAFHTDPKEAVDLVKRKAAYAGALFEGICSFYNFQPLLNGGLARALKKDAAALAKRWGVAVPKDFDPEPDYLGTAARKLLCDLAAKA